MRGAATAVSVPAMPSLRRPPRPTLALALLGALGLGSLAACEKTPDAGTTAPAADVPGGTSFAYKAAPTKLKQNMTVSVTTSGMFNGGLKIDATSLLDVGAAGDKLKVGFRMLEVRSIETSGEMKQEPKAGEPPPDLKAKLMAATGAKVVDLHGNADEEATKALAENADKKGPNLSDAFIGLPSELPVAALLEGKPVKTSKRTKETVMGGMAMDMDVDVTYTLVKIDASSGKRLAELKIESEGSGATDITQGGKSVSVAMSTSGDSTIVFDLDAQLPVRAHMELTQNGGDEKRNVETRIIIDTTYEPAT